MVQISLPSKNCLPLGRWKLPRVAEVAGRSIHRRGNLFSDLDVENWVAEEQDSNLSGEE